MATIVIVHGSFSGGWQWRRVRSLLRAAGHDVSTPTLTGLGERAHLAHPGIDLETHVQDIASHLDHEELRAVTLVGTSYSGMVITGVADRAADRLARLVYIEAWVPEDGQSLLDLVGPERATALRAQVEAEGDGWRVQPFPISSPSLDLRRDDDARFYASRRVAQPFKTYEQRLRLTNPAARALPRTYIDCTLSGASRGGPYQRYIVQAQRAPGWHYREIAAGHLPHVTAPRELADLLGAIADEPGGSQQLALRTGQPRSPCQTPTGSPMRGAT